MKDDAINGAELAMLADAARGRLVVERSLLAESMESRGLLMGVSLHRVGMMDYSITDAGRTALAKFSKLVRREGAEGRDDDYRSDMSEQDARLWMRRQNRELAKHEARAKVLRAELDVLHAEMARINAALDVWASDGPHVSQPPDISRVLGKRVAVGLTDYATRNPQWHVVRGVVTGVERGTLVEVAAAVQPDGHLDVYWPRATSATTALPGGWSHTEWRPNRWFVPAEGGPDFVVCVEQERMPPGSIYRVASVAHLHLMPERVGAEGGDDDS